LIEYGNAILSIWPLSEPEKIVLPNFIPHWLEDRNSARATISLGGREITVYNTHLDTYWSTLQRGVSQAEFLRRALSEQDGFVIIGGDFNTWNPASIASLDRRMEAAGLLRLTEGAGATFEWRGINLTLDHIYSSAVESHRSGIYRQTDASDHYPLWAEIMMK
jgi:endonuclease/exonuclease/phosphatase family metal-dependent hydrolase